MKKGRVDYCIGVAALPALLLDLLMELLRVLLVELLVLVLRHLAPVTSRHNWMHFSYSSRQQPQLRGVLFVVNWDVGVVGCSGAKSEDHTVIQ